MRERPSRRTSFLSCSREASSAGTATFLATLGLVSAGIALGAIGDLDTRSSSPTSRGPRARLGGRHAVNLVGNQFSPAATVTIGGVGVSAVVHEHDAHQGDEPVARRRARSTTSSSTTADRRRAPEGLVLRLRRRARRQAPFHAPVETIIRDGITAGCGGGNYCASASITRAQMAVFLLRAEHGSAYVPPPATGTIFGDVHQGDFAADWIEQLYAEGITGGCQAGTPPNYCPTSSVTARPDVGLPAEDLPRHRLRAARGDRRLLGRADHEPVRTLGRGARAPLRHDRLRRHAPTARTMPSRAARWRSFSPRRSTAPMRRASSSRRPGARRTPTSAGVLGQGYLPWLANAVLAAAPPGYPAQNLVPEQRADELRRRHRCEPAELPARQLLDVPAVHDVLHERALRARPAAPARRLRAPEARRRFDQHDHAAERRSFPYLNIILNNAFGNYRDILSQPDAESGHGRLPQHELVHQEQPERELRARESCSCSRSGPSSSTRTARRRTTRSPDLPLPTYDQSVIDNLKLVFTGWKIPNVTVPTLAGDSGETAGDYISPMTLQSSEPQHGREGSLRPGRADRAAGVPPEPERERLAHDHRGRRVGRRTDLPQALDALFNHPNVGAVPLRGSSSTASSRRTRRRPTSSACGVLQRQRLGHARQPLGGREGDPARPGGAQCPERPDVRQAQGAGRLRCSASSGLSTRSRPIGACRPTAPSHTCANCTRDQGEEVFKPAPCSATSRRTTSRRRPRPVCSAPSSGSWTPPRR